MTYRTLHRHEHHLGWSRDEPPRLVVAPGEVVEVRCHDASGGRLGADSTVADLLALDPAAVNPVTGPIHVDGAGPGDALVVELLELSVPGHGWTALIPGFGLLADDFPDPWLNLSTTVGGGVEFLPGVVVPARPFTGTIGVAPAAPGRHDVIPPRRVGGNMDTRDLVAGAILHLPVEVEGALLSVGDTHAAQGDGEVCGTAVETALDVRLRVSVEEGAAPRGPRLWAPPSARAGQDPAGHHATLGIGDDLMQAARDATRGMIDLLTARHGLAPEEAYALCSVAGDLALAEVVDAPNWVVAMRFPAGIPG